MQTKPHLSKMADIDEKIVPITVPVVPAQGDPVFTRLTSFSLRARSYKEEREQALSEVKALIELGYEAPNSTPLSKERSLWKADELGLTTLKVLASEFSDGDGPQRLVQFLSSGDPDNFAGFRYFYHGANRETMMRELAVFSHPFPTINEKMMFVMLEGLRTSYPMFAREDLTELRGAEAEAFMLVLSFTVAAYERQSSKQWKQVEASTWNDEDVMHEAIRRTPRFNKGFIDLLIERPDRHADIMRFIWLDNTDLLEINKSKVEAYIDSSVTVSQATTPTLSSILTDTGILLGSYVRLGRSKIGIK